MAERSHDFLRVIAVLVVATSATARAQDAPASGPDVAARVVFDELGRRWKQQVVILNATGAGGSVAAKQAVQAQPDGYTFYLPGASAFIVMPECFRV